jgi:hypothetical protein
MADKNTQPSTCLIIAGFAGIGKTTTAQKYKEIIDLEHNPFKYDYSDQENVDFEKMKGTTDRKIRPGWEQTYIQAIKHHSKTALCVFVYAKEEMLQLYERENIKFAVCYPDRDSFEKFYISRYRQRGNSQAYIDKILNHYSRHIPVLASKNTQQIVLHGNQTIEDWLLANGYLK